MLTGHLEILILQIRKTEQGSQYSNRDSPKLLAGGVEAENLQTDLKPF